MLLLPALANTVRLLALFMQEDVIAEAHLDGPHIFEAIKRFATDRKARLARLHEALGGL